MMTKVKPINLGYHVTDYDTFLSRELLSDDFAVDAYTHAYYDGACVATFMNVSLNEAQQVVLEANRQRVSAPYYLRPGQAMENQHVVKFGAAPLDNKLFFSMENPAQAERRYMASVVHPDYCVSINT